MIQFFKKNQIKKLNVLSKAFNNYETIPRKYTCDGLNVSPPLEISFIPNEAVSMVVIMEDPDAPINTWQHWLVWNIPVTHHIDEDAIRGIKGLNDFNKHFYCGPCPMSGIHQYVYKVYVLDCLLDLNTNTKRKELERAMSDHILAYGELTGYYGRHSNDLFASKN